MLMSRAASASLTSRLSHTSGVTEEPWEPMLFNCAPLRSDGRQWQGMRPAPCGEGQIGGSDRPDRSRMTVHRGSQTDQRATSPPTFPMSQPSVQEASKY